MISTLLGIAMLVLTSRMPAQTPAADETAVRNVVTALFNGMRTVDSAMVRPLFHPKARLITLDSRSPGTRIEESADGFIQSIGRPRTEVFDERLSNVRVMIDGSLASVWADYTFYRGATLVHCGVDHFLLVKEGGTWKILEVADTRRSERCGG